MTIQTTQASEATQAVASLAEAAITASQEMQPGATVTMALNRYGWERWEVILQGLGEIRLLKSCNVNSILMCEGNVRKKCLIQFTRNVPANSRA